MNGYCNMCGKCCEAITLWVAPEDIAKGSHNEGSDHAWAQEHFHEITKEEAYKRNPLHEYVAENRPDVYEGVHFYECDALDKKTKRCTAHDKRPRVCRGYPHYNSGTQIKAGFIPYSTTCDYLHDMPPAMKQEWIEVELELRKNKGLT